MSSSTCIQSGCLFLRQIADARQYGDRVGDGIEPKDAHRAAFRAQQPQNVFDERRLAGSVCADEAVDPASGHGQAH